MVWIGMFRTVALSCILVMVMLAPARTLSDSRATAPAQVVVTVRQEQQMSVAGNQIKLRIRLRPGTTALLWMADKCSRPPDDAYVVPRSGHFEIPLDRLPGTAAQFVCLRSSDAELSDSVRVVPGNQ